MNVEELKEYNKKLSKLSKNEEKKRNQYIHDLTTGKVQGPRLNYPSIDRAYYKHYSIESINKNVENKSPCALFEETCKKYKHQKHLTYIPANNFSVNITFYEEEKKIRKYAKALASFNPSKDEIIVTILPNTPEAKELLFSAMKIGVPIFPINPLLPATFLDKIINENNIKNIFIFSGFIDKYSNVLKSNEDKLDRIIHLDGSESINNVLLKAGAKLKRQALKRLDSKKTMEFDEFEKSSENFYGDIDEYYIYDENRTMLLESTSGTTGIPKAVEITGKNIMAFITQHTKDFMDFTHGDRYLDIMNNSLSYGALSSIVTSVFGIRTYFRPGFTMDPISDILKYKINQMVGGPVHAKALANYLMKDENRKKINVKNWCSGGAPLPKNIEETINKTSKGYIEKTSKDDNIIVRQGCGLTECLGAVFYQKEGTYKFGSIGVPMCKMTVSIFNPGTDEEMKYNEIGEICVTGDTIMKGYLNNKEETDKILKLHSDGRIWVHTKDIGYIDQDGVVFFLERVKNMFERNGINVHPNTIAEFIRSLDYVDDAAVVGVPHPNEQEVPVAFIKLKGNYDVLEIIKEEILKECYNNLEESSIPYEIRFVNNIPINAGGKPDTNYLLKNSNIDYYKEDKVKTKKLSVESINLFEGM